MKASKTLQVLAVLMVVGFSASPAANETARLPYIIIYQQIEVFESLEHLDKIAWQMNITSNDSSVGPDDIEVSVNDGNGVHPFKLGPAGEVDIPKRDDWAAIDALTVDTNQPSGSLNLNVTFNVRRLPGSPIQYSWLDDLSRQLEQALVAQAPVVGETPPKVVGLRFIYPEGVNAEVRILAAAGERKLTPGPEGVLLIRIDPELASEDPEVAILPLPESVLPWVERVTP